MLWRFADLAVASDVPFPDLPAASAPAAITVCRGVPAPDGWQPIQVWTGEAGEDWLTIEAGHGGYRLQFAGLTCAIAADGSRITYAPAAGSTTEDVAHLLLHQALPLAVSRLGRIVVHACAVETPRGAVAFVGGSGAGKSTLAAACCARGAALLADDALVAEFRAGEVMALPTANGLRLWDDVVAALPGGELHARAGEKRRIPTRLATTPARLARLFLVGETSASGVVVSGVPPEAARVALLPHLFRLDVTDAAESRRMFDDVHRLASLVPMRRLVFPDGVEALAPAVAAVLADLEETE